VKNVIHGTVVDTEIISPNYWDFFLVSHNVPSNFSTAKPTRFVYL
jgi:hypothetical protein